MNDNIVDQRPLRVLITSDVHYTHEKKWYGVTCDERMQLWVDTIKAEHKKHPFDLILFAGDTSLDHYLMKGSYTARGISETREFMEKYVSQLPKDVPMLIGPGNHELYNDEQWEAYTGNGRQASIAVGNELFILVDTFRTALEPHFDGNLAKYTPVDVSYVEAQMAAYPNHRVWLISHYFDVTRESEEFRRLIRENDRIIGLFAGHAHQCSVIYMGEDYGNKTVAQTGNFSYSYFTAFPTGDINDVYRSFWGFRELTITSD